MVGVPTLPNNTDVRLLKGAVRHLDGRAGPLEGTVLGVRADWLHVTWLKNICGSGAVPLAALGPSLQRVCVPMNVFAVHIKRTVCRPCQC